jgi:hypothetical protein
MAAISLAGIGSYLHNAKLEAQVASLLADREMLEKDLELTRISNEWFKIQVAVSEEDKEALLADAVAELNGRC